MNLFILGVDAGASKTIGRIKCLETNQTWQQQAGAGSLTNDFSSASDHILTVIEQLLNQANCLLPQVSLVCGVAGAGNRHLHQQLMSKLALGFNQLEITTDARTALYGAGNGEPILAVSIGTGSVAVRLDKNATEQIFGGWGFAAGDLGGGAYIGRELITMALNELDKGKIKDPLIKKVLSIIGEDRAAILPWFKSVTPKKFAELAPLVCNAAPQNNKAKAIMQKAAAEIETIINNAQIEPALPVALLGGLAEFILPYLNPQIKNNIIKAKGDSVDGALFLARKNLA